MNLGTTIPIEEAIKLLLSKEDFSNVSELEHRINAILFNSIALGNGNHLLKISGKNVETKLTKTNLKSTEESPNQFSIDKKIDARPSKKALLLEQTKLHESSKDKETFRAPFDFFGVNPRFYVNGRNRTLTWIGCLCSTILVGSIITIFIFFLRSHTQKVEAIVNSFETDIEEHNFFDMSAGK